jgi:hypothetical protein
MWQWILWNASIIEIGLALVGFGFTWYQITRTRSAAEASEKATKAALKAMSERFTLADLSAISSVLGEVQTALRGARIETALIRTQGIREQIIRLRSRAGFTSTTRRTQIQKMVIDLGRLQSALETKLLDPSFKIDVTKANDLLASHIGMISEWGEELKFASRSELS